MPVSVHAYGVHLPVEESELHNCFLSGGPLPETQRESACGSSPCLSEWISMDTACQVMLSSKWLKKRASAAKCSGNSKLG